MDSKVSTGSKWQAKTNFPTADFWLTNKGSLDTLGTPLKTFEPYYIGILCPQFIVPDYGFYLFVYLRSQGIWKQLAVGTTAYKSLRIREVRRVLADLSLWVELSVWFKTEGQQDKDETGLSPQEYR
ncbi:hypothetical protein PN462_21100 [Spirulina sp. CS-785/01]|uniref:hypothetical protein n=1 Tax=Spirulina sp. CS-785/01 TaxID=3021716 RepID=UPI00232DA75C|nr:hypothetical protein [Spirulina sp. CS-785/01]MDB9315624.1 hypothetical protein [Spirulina sp. CS-785/01]